MTPCGDTEFAAKKKVTGSGGGEQIRQLINSDRLLKLSYSDKTHKHHGWVNSYIILPAEIFFLLKYCYVS